MSRILEKRHVIISEVRYDLLKPLWSSYWRWQEVHQHCRLLMETFLFPAYWALKFEISVTVSFFPITGPKSRDATLELSSNFFFKKKGHCRTSGTEKSNVFFDFDYIQVKQPEPQISPAPHVRIARTLWYRERWQEGYGTWDTSHIPAHTRTVHFLPSFWAIKFNGESLHC